MSSVQGHTRKSARSGNRSTLQKLVDAAGAQKHGCTWSHVLQYLKAHADVSEAHEGRDLGFESPLQTYYTANSKLQSELHMDDSGHSILKSSLAIGAPRKVIAALCHLGPSSLQKPDLQGRLLLHSVCRYPDMPDKILTLLVNAYPAALLYRDNQGRTPLHYLMWYHCEERSSAIVDLFCQNLTNHKTAKQVFQAQVSQGKPLPKLYQNKLHASVIPDAVFGSLPIHYAVMHGASKATITVLLQHLPVSKHAMDRHGHTPLHWYVGAGLPVQEDHLVHVTGEETKLDGPYYERTIQPEIVSLLLSSRVARTVDRFERTVLHCFCKLAAHKLMHGQAVDVDIIHRLLGAFAGQLSSKDSHGKTPAVVLLGAVYYIQKRRWESGNRAALRLDMPMELVHILLSKDPKVAQLEDANGRLPIHAALAVGASPEVVSLLIEQHPNSLMHVDENLEVPLHAALCHPWSASLQSRETIDLLLSKQYERQGTVVDGRLAMKMEDSDGYYPIHYACIHDAPLEVIQCMVEKYARCTMLQTPVGDLPVHCLLLENEAVIEDALVSNDSQHYLNCRAKLQVLLRPLLSAPDKLRVADSRRGMLPLHIAVLFEAVEYSVLLHMLELYPEGAMHFTSNLFLEKRDKTPLTCSPLDFHEICQRRKDSKLEAWHRVRELLFAFSPTLESHRHREELLERCVRIVIDELNDTTRDSSFHLNANNDKNEHPPDIEITHTVSAMEAELRGSTSFGSRKKQRRNRRGPVSRILSPNKSRYNPHSRSRTRIRQADSGSSGGEAPEPIQNRVARLTAASSSMYDEEDTGFDTYDTGDHDDGTSFTDTAGDDGDESQISGTDGTGTFTEDEYTSGTGTGTFGDDTRTIDYSTSGSRLPTTFEDASSGSSDESDSFDEETQTSLSRNGPSHSYEGSVTIGESRSGLSRHTYNYEGSTAGRLTHGHTSSDESDDESQEVIFDRLKQKASGEEKKEEEIQQLNDSILTPRFSNHRKHPDNTFHRPSYMSEVAMRLWTFFVLYCDPNNPSDHYAKQVAEIVDEVAFSTVQRLVSNPLPPYADNYVHLEKVVDGLRYIDVASPKCRELIHKTGYFLGRYEFVTGNEILVYRSEKDTSIILEAREWLFTTEETTDAKKPGMAEENIWATGEVPAEVNATFRSKQRPVWIKFTKSPTIFNNEIKSRELLGVAIDDHSQQAGPSLVAGVLRHFNAIATAKKADRIYKVHTSDKRFNTLSLFGNSAGEGDMKVILDQYPYAIVFDEPPRGTLHEYYQRNGITSLTEATAIAKQIAESLEQLHTKGLCYGDVCMKNVVSLSRGNGEKSCRWGLFDLSCTSSISDDGGMLGEVDEKGRPRFHTDTLPPEMFSRVSPVGLKRYENYWESIEKQFKVRLDPQIKLPIVDDNNGAIYVVKCHFASPAMNPDDEVPLPYELVQPSASVDIWAFGCLLFQLLTGRSLFPVSIRERQLQDYSVVCNFDAEAVVYDHVTDPIVQDLLIKCLSAQTKRKKCSMADILQHPFFCETDTFSDALRDLHVSRTAGRGRSKTLLSRDRYEKEIMEAKTREITCWDFDALERFHQVPTQIVRSLSGRSVAGVVPCGLLPLPFDCPSTTSELNETIAERLGRELLLLSKVCFFSSVMEQTTSRDKKFRGKPWPESEAKRVLDLSSSEFGSIQSQMADLAAKHVEAFRNDPMSIAQQLVRQRLQDVLEVFDGHDLYLHFMDEYSGGVLDEAPVTVPDVWRDNVSRSGFHFLFLSSLYVRGMAGGTAGLARLFRLDTVPETWKVAATGLAHVLDGDFFVNELLVLEQAMGALFQTQHSVRDSLNTMYDFLQDVGHDQALEGLFRVVVGGEACFWVCADSLQQLEQSQTSFKDALKNYHSRKV